MLIDLLIRSSNYSKGKSESICPLVVLTLWSHGLCPASLLCPWNYVGKNTGVGSHSLLQGIGVLLTEFKPRFSALQADSLPSEPLEKPPALMHGLLWIENKFYETSETCHPHKVSKGSLICIMMINLLQGNENLLHTGHLTAKKERQCLIKLWIFDATYTFWESYSLLWCNWKTNDFE